MNGGRPKPTAGQAGLQRSYRGLLYGVVVRDYPKQFVSLTNAKSVPTNMREFLSWVHRHYRIDVTTSTRLTVSSKVSLQVQNHCHLNSHTRKSNAQVRTILFDYCRAQAGTAVGDAVPMDLSMLGKGGKGKGQGRQERQRQKQER